MSAAMSATCPVCGETRFDDRDDCPACGHPYDDPATDAWLDDRDEGNDDDDSTG